jgi:hypothetical protein
MSKSSAQNGINETPEALETYDEAQSLFGINCKLKIIILSFKNSMDIFLAGLILEETPENPVPQKKTSKHKNREFSIFFTV